MPGLYGVLGFLVGGGFFGAKKGRSGGLGFFL